MTARLVWGGIKSYLPIPPDRYKGTGGTISAAYSYTIWLRHLSLIAQYAGVGAFKPKVVVELGPGDSIGVGLAALLSVADAYVGLDVIEHSSVENNLRVLHELVELFAERRPLPDETMFPRAHPRLASYAFPSGILDGAEIDGRLSKEHVAALEDAVARIEDPSGEVVRYVSPWRHDSVPAGSADLVLSQGALQDMDHTAARDDLRANIAAMVRWLKPGGVMSHHIELACPGGEEWNHHWAYGPLAWSIIRGRRPYYKNRVPLSEYKRLFAEAGLSLAGVVPFHKPGLPRDAVASRFRDLPDEDFRTAAALIIATKPR